MLVLSTVTLFLSLLMNTALVAATEETTFHNKINSSPVQNKTIKKLNSHSMKTISSLRGIEEECTAIPSIVENPEIMVEFGKAFSITPGSTTFEFPSDGAYTNLLRSKCAAANGNLYFLTISYQCYMDGLLSLYKKIDDIDDNTIGLSDDQLSQVVPDVTLKNMPICVANCLDVKTFKGALNVDSTCTDSVTVENSGRILSGSYFLAVVGIISSAVTMLLM